MRIYVALHLPTSTKALLLEGEARSIHPANPFPSSSGFEVVVESIAPGPNGSVRICLQLTDARYADVFAVLVDDVAAAVASATSETMGILALIGRLSTWQRFFKQHGGGLLSKQECIGLFAELIVLRELLADDLAASEAVRAWRGPWGGAQDFSLATCSIEVKAALTMHAVSVEVSNLSQLDDRGLACLILRHLTLRQVQQGGEALPALIDSIRQVIFTDAAASLSFSDSLLEAGYLEIHRRAYEEDRYAVHSDRQFQVKEGFPRILTDEIRQGITACSYSIALAACLPFQIDEIQAKQIVRGGYDE